MTKPWAGQTMETRIWLSWVKDRKTTGSGTKCCCAWANAFRLVVLTPWEEHRGHEQVRLAKKYDRTASVADDANKNMSVVSQIQKNDRLREEVLLNIRWRMLFGIGVTYILRRRTLRSFLRTSHMKLKEVVYFSKNDPGDQYSKKQHYIHTYIHYFLKPSYGIHLYTCINLFIYGRPASFFFISLQASRLF